VRRYRETRRRHPLSPTTEPAEGVALEIDMLAPIRARADVLIDSTGMSPHELKAEIGRWFALGTAPGLVVSLNSFSYKRGVPRGLDLMFDCRLLDNPHWVPELRALDGRSEAVAAHVMADQRFAEFCKRLEALLLFVLPEHLREGKSHIAIGFGCTGGQHRSVVVTEYMAALLSAAGWKVVKRHRELERKAGSESVGSVA
ncbi:RNase adapter RapZ, partial [Phaeovulum sp.]|uniref:RNase adapter RapZ n=1 Tax=Phaeovulum sp. TaxID=2934796 RepID=UPI0035653243